MIGRIAAVRAGMGRAAIASLTIAIGLGSVPAAHAQDEQARLRKVEAEIKALQRKVFPGTDGRYFEPEITGSAAPATPPTGTPSATAVTDILARLDSLESQLARLTAQTEENTNAIGLLSTRVGRLEPQASVILPAPPTTGELEPAQAAPRTTPTPAPAVTGPSAERLARVRAILKPQTDDAGGDEYSYGFRLWEAKLYPEAEQQLRMFVDKYPAHAQISYGRNLLGRAYLDEGKPREAAPFFLQNYQADKAGARAGDSLLFLAESMIALKDTKRACIALAEFGDSYPALASGRLADQYQAQRKRVTCN